MAAFGTYYIDAPTFASATGIFTDAALTTCAPDGYYSDGVIYRELTACVLGSAVTCPSCLTPCGTPISGSGSNDGVYDIPFTVGSGTGAIIVTITPTGTYKPIGIKATFNSNIYNKLSTTNFGYKASSVVFVPTYLGDTAADCGIVAGSPYTLQTYSYAGGVFTGTGLYVTEGITAAQLQLTVGTPGASVLVIPKPLAGPTTMDLEIIAPCTSTGFDVTIACPTALTGFTSTFFAAAAATDACAIVPPTAIYYNAPVTGTAGNPGLHDWIFTDPNGEFKLASAFGAGYYKWVNAASPSGFSWIQIDANSVVISTGNCP